MRSMVLLTLSLLVGCGARVSPDGSGSGNDQLGGAESDPVSETGPAEPPPPSSSDAGAPTPVDAGPAPAPTIGVDEIAFILVEDTMTGEPHKIRLDADCRVTDHNGLNAFAKESNCKETFAIAVDPKSYGCGPGGTVGKVVVQLKDGRSLVRDLSADRCSVVIPSLPTHKYMYAAWYSAGGRG